MQLSYQAKAFGVSGGMPGRRARELCPELIFVDGAFSRITSGFGDAAIAVLGDFTPQVERISIDEAFADVAGLHAHLFGTPAGIARPRIRSRVRTDTRAADFGRRGTHKNIWPRSPRRLRNPTGLWWSIPTANWLSFMICPSS